MDSIGIGLDFDCLLYIFVLDGIYRSLMVQNVYFVYVFDSIKELRLFSV